MTSPRLSEDTPRGRMYRLEPGGELMYPSITTISGMRAKDSLNGWYAHKASERALEMYAWLDRNPHRAQSEISRVARNKWTTQKAIAAAAPEYTARAADFGTLVHAVCEEWGRSSQRPTPDAISAMAEQMKTESGMLASEDNLQNLLDRVAVRLDGYAGFLDDFQPEFIEVEQTVVNHSVGYAGTTDAIVKVGGALLSGDIKTSKKVRGDYALQGVAIVNAELMLDDDGSTRPMPDLAGAFVIHLPDKGGYNVIPLRTGEAEFEVFKALKTAWTFEPEQCALRSAPTPQQLMLSLLKSKPGMQ